MKIKLESNLNPANIDLSEYEYCSHANGRDAHWQLYRKIVDGKGKWVARHDNTGEIKEINYDQVRGFEPIDDSSISRLSRDLGKMLMPKKESKQHITGKYGEVSYLPREDGLPGETPNYVGFRIYSNDDKYELWWAGQSRMGGSYSSIQDAVEGADAVIDSARSKGKFLFLKPVKEGWQEDWVEPTLNPNPMAAVR